MAVLNTFPVDEACAHLRGADPELATVMDRIGPYTAQLREGEPFASLLRTILFQQLAGAAANAIQGRLLALYGNANLPPSPAQLLATTDEQFRAAGVSRQKVGYMRDLAIHVSESRLKFDEFGRMGDAEVISQLTAVKGLGEWSAHMYLMFHLGRPDVLPIGDLGVRNGMKITYNLAEAPTPAGAREIGLPWAPYRSVGSWYMWQAGEPTAPDI